MDAAHLLLDAYAGFAGLPDLSFNEDGCARLRFGPDIAVNLEADAGGEAIHLYAVLGPLPPGARDTLYAELLESNLFGQATAGATLAIDAVQQELVLCRRAELDAGDVQRFARMLEDFADMAMQWQHRVASGVVSDTPPATSPPTGWEAMQRA